jgi:ABC-type phosphate transport system substrate-binding protein
MSRRRQRLAFLVVPALVALLALLAGCGVTIKGTAEQGEPGPLEEKTAKVVSETGALPPRPAGTVRLDGVAPGSLTAKLLKKYRQRGTVVSFHSRDAEEGEAFEALCGGTADVVASQRPISPSVYAGCQANGVEPVQLEIASDATILAIENETDVGVDCMSVESVREVFRAASPITSWSQVGYGRNPGQDVNAMQLKVAGPEPTSGPFSSFSELVLGDSEPSRLLLRGDYKAYKDEAEVLEAVAGDTEETQLAGHGEEFARSAVALEAALKEAEKAVEVAEFQVEKGIADGRSEVEQEEDAETLSEAEAKVEELGNEAEEASSSAAEVKEATGKVAERLGTLGLFRFDFYELWEERLRPMEIEATNSESRPECIFPSQATVTAATYPLAHQLLLTVNLKTMKEAEVNQFLAFALDHSQQTAVEETLVPLPDEVKDTELAWLRGDVAPDVVYYPPSRILRDEKESTEGEPS